MKEIMQFQTIGIVGRIDKSETISTVVHVIELLRSRNLGVVLSNEVSKSLEVSDIECYPRDELGEFCDLVVVVGGDGSMLGAARDMCTCQVPVVGVNRGRLGFLTDVSPRELDVVLGDILDGKYRSEERALLDMELIRDQKNIIQNSAFNDVVLSSNKAARMIEFEIYIDDVFVTHQRGDGLIISTATGSTAYALSAGGPILSPTLDAIVVLPMFPHKLSSRPIVIDGNSEIKLIMDKNIDVGSMLSCDGHSRVPVQSLDGIRIKKKKEVLQLLHPLGHDFYSTCRDKLGWG
jgi:NAD+ kinase